MRSWLIVAALLSGTPAVAGEITVTTAADHLLIDTDALTVRVNTKGYVSGTAAGGLLDKKTGARDLGFGLHVMDFLLAPGARDDGYMNEKTHGKIAKHYVEGPQICTQAKELTPEIFRGTDFVAVRFRYTFSKPGQGYKVGSTWEQTLLFQPDLRYFLSAERITSVNDVPSLFYRIDLPGHIKHKNGDTFEKIWLSYEGDIPASDFAQDFPPDARHLYQRCEGKIPERMIRAYQVKRDGQPGPWLAGMTLDPAEVSEAWCHQRGYICFIEELHARPTKAGGSFGAAYVVGWFDDKPEMERIYDRYKGATRIELHEGKFELK
ncbi:MAG: hypothetical protein ACJ8F7_13150 [Gemmataceae bacterium]